jgi:hypothetical protein
MLWRILAESQPHSHWDLLDLVAELVVVNAASVNTLQRLRQHARERPAGVLTKQSDLYSWQEPGTLQQVSKVTPTGASGSVYGTGR